MAGQTINVSVLADTKQFRSQMAGIGNQSGLSKLTAGAKAAGAALAAVTATAAVAAGAAIVKLGKDAIDAASGLQQSTGAIDTVFKANATTMHTWAAGASQSVGLTKNEFNGLGTLIGTQLKNGGTAMADLAPKTNNLIKLGADLSSMYGGTTKDAVEALSSALKGERDPVERYGVSLNQAAIDAEAARLGFKKVGGALSSEANQAATLSLITKQTADAHGNFAKESNTLEHQQQVLKASLGNVSAELGTKLLPAATAATQWLGARIPAASAAVSRAMDVIGPILRTAGSALQTAFTAAGPAISGLQAKLAPLTAWISGTLIPSLSSFGATVASAFGTAGQIIGQIITGLQARLQPIMPQVMATFSAIGSIITGALSLIGAVISAFVTTAQGFWSRWGATILSVASTVFSAVVGVVRPALQTISAIIRTVTALIRGDWSGAWQGIKQITSGAIATIRGVVSGGTSILRSLVSAAGRAMVSSIVSMASGLRSAFSSAWSAARSATSSGISAVLSFVRALPRRVTGALSGMASATVSVGRNIIRGIINGVSSMVGSLVSSARSAVSSAISAAKSALGIHSPSRVFAGIGANIIAGLVKGLDGNRAKVTASINRIIGKIQTSKLHKRSALVRWVATEGAALQRLAGQRDKIASQLKAAGTKLTALKKSWSDAKASAADHIAQAFDLSSLVLKDGSGNVRRGSLSSATISRYVGDLAAKARTFATRARGLSKAGYPTGLIQEIAGYDLDTALEVSRALLSAPTGQRKAIKTNWHAFNSAASGVGTSIANSLYDAGLQAQRGLIRGLTAKNRALDRAAGTLASRITSQVKRSLGIHSPSRVFAAIGAQTIAGMIQGLDGGRTRLTRAGDRVAATVTRAATPDPILTDPRRPGAGLTVNVTAQMLEPDAMAARKLSQLIASTVRDLNRRGVALA